VLAMREQFAGGQRRGDHDFLVRAFAQRPALEVDDRAFAASTAGRCRRCRRG
jgi:hypothetical protein